MKASHFVSCLCCLFVYLAPAAAQTQEKLSPAEYQQLPLAEMPVRDNATLLAAEEKKRRPGRANTFAVTSPTKIRPSSDGNWSTLATGEMVWRLRVRSAGARTLNLGFSEFQLPAGARLFLTGKDGDQVGPFTPADNEAHNQLWTPIVDGDELLLELFVPAAQQDRVRLFLTAVNHDFEGINKVVSGRCNIDVVCGEADGLPIIERYRDIIRSVAAYTISGTDVCTGFLVNNADEDGEPLFMTAAHCNVSSARAPALTAYWNYENSDCRQPDSNDSGRPGDGRRNITNRGAVLLANYAPSDMTLLRFDDPVNPDANAFYAGWSALAEVPTDTMIAIHHPGVEEKRISFSFQDPYRAVFYGDPDPDANHLEIPDWDLGTTEGGSSGSPIFDRFKRVRGQLHGGDAGCGNDEFDSYGFFFSSWEGGGTPASRLKDWLDPCGTGTLVLDGLEYEKAQRSILADANCFSGCATVAIDLDLQLGAGFEAEVPVTIVSAPDVLSVSLSETTATGGETLLLSIVGDEDTPGGSYQIVVRAGDAETGDDITIRLELAPGITLAGPVLTSPVSGATDVVLNGGFRWQPIEAADTYTFQLAADPDFAVVLADIPNLTVPLLQPALDLEVNTTYYWRTRGTSLCGDGEWSDTANFTVGGTDCDSYAASGLPVAISTGPGDTYRIPLEVTEEVTIAGIGVRFGIEHSWIGDLQVALVSPGGQRVELVDLNRTTAGCDADNLYLDIEAGAAANHNALLVRCEDNLSGDYQSFRPLESFAPLLGTSSLGTWTLEVTDNATRDGGSIENFSLTLCTGIDALGDFGLTAISRSLTTCSDVPSSVTLRLGNDYPANTLLLIEADGTMLDNYTYEFDPVSREITVDFSAWGLVGEGDFDLNFRVENPEGVVRTTTIPLTVVGDTGLALLTGPEDGTLSFGDPITFRWSAADNAEAYQLQIATDENFDDQVFGTITTATSETVAELELGTYFWRVVTTGPCGPTTSEVRTIRFNTTGTQTFTGDRSVVVFPNPLRDRISLRFEGSWTEAVELRLFSAGGRLLRTMREATPRGTASYELGSLPAGIYYLRLESNGQQRTEKLVVLP